MVSLETVTKDGGDTVTGDAVASVLWVITVGLLRSEEKTASLFHITQVPLAPEQPESLTSHLHVCPPPFKLLLDEQGKNMVTCSDCLRAIMKARPLIAKNPVCGNWDENIHSHSTRPSLHRER